MSIRNAKGQMAIFFVLSFQMLFILFAMTINVTLVVHDKINLQNSLDLAVYYGASKQAEVLNAISHINYQMRQNYKLLAWRYRVLSSLALAGGGNEQASSVYKEAWCPENRRSIDSCAPDRNPKCNSIYPQGYCDIAYNVCVSSSAWSRGINDNSDGSSTNICLNTNFQPPDIPSYNVVASFNPINLAAQRTQEELRDSITTTCGKEQSLNKIMANLFLSHFRLDQKDRKIMIKAIYDASLKQGRDLDGNFIEDGARKVFQKNLNFTNQKNYRKQIEGTEFFNSLTERNFEDIFEAINILPILFFLELNDGCGGTSKLLITSNDRFSNNTRFMKFIKFHKDLFDLNVNNHVSNIARNNLGTLTLGFRKKLEPLIFYAGISNLNYSNLPQLFSPKPSEVEKRQLKALSFAKPFGSQIGPNYNDPNIDPIIQPQILENASKGSIDYYNSQPNYSRYPGDKWGLIDKTVHEGAPFLRKTDTFNGSPYNIASFDHLQTPDALSRTETNDGTLIPNHFVRLMEMAAVFPDLFDLTYYNISPSYMTTYFPRICSLIGQGGSCGPIVYSESESQAFIRGDFGYDPQEAAMHGYYMQQNAGGPKIRSSVWPWFLLKGKNQAGQPVNVKPFRTETTNFEDFTQMIRYNYWVQDPAHFLTSWLPTTKNTRYEDYSFPEEDFAKCFKPTDKVPSGCAVGGRAGYSVKLFSCNIAKTLSNQPAFADVECP